MISARRIHIACQLMYESVQILDSDEQLAKGMDNYFEGSQVVWECNDGVFIAPDYNIVYVHLGTSPTRLPYAHAKRFTRLTLSYEVVFEQVWVLDPMKTESLGLPLIFSPLEQFVFASAEGLFVTADYQVMQLQI